MNLKALETAAKTEEQRLTRKMNTETNPQIKQFIEIDIRELREALAEVRKIEEAKTAKK